MPQSYIDLLKEYLAFQSISTDKTHAPDMQKTAARLRSQFLSHGFHTDVIEGYGNPIVVASYIADPRAPICLIYGHYDVQPATKEDGRHKDPFELDIQSEKIVGRGVVDNKGQTLIHMVTIFDLIKAKKLAYNITFMIEGDEETGSPLLPKFVQDYEKKLQADFALISDGEIIGKYPTIESWFRGGFNMTLTLQTADTDVHSGIFGGTIPNALHEMTKLLSGIYNPQHMVTIPYFYYGVDDVDATTLENNAKIPFAAEEIQNIIGCKTIRHEKNIDYYTQVGLRPAIEITGIQWWYVSEGYRNAIPATATAKINIRLVAHQDPDKITHAITSRVNQQLPTYVSHTIQIDNPYEATKIDLTSHYVQKVADAMATAFGEDVIYRYSGGGMPIAALFQNQLKLTPIFASLWNEDCRMHGVGENFRIDCIEKGFAFSKEFFGKR
jgi:acetylornithine deacetylase/succinyl-diaminopimelate desuccinylase-like protein